MVEIRLVTVHGCPGADCGMCARGEATMKRVLEILGIPLPEHQEGGPGEAYLDDGRVLEVHHLSCADAGNEGLDPAHAPFLIVDGVVVLSGPAMDEEPWAEAIVRALYPDGLAGDVA